MNFLFATAFFSRNQDKIEFYFFKHMKLQLLFQKIRHVSRVGSCPFLSPIIFFLMSSEVPAGIIDHKESELESYTWVGVATRKEMSKGTNKRVNVNLAGQKAYEENMLKR